MMLGAGGRRPRLPPAVTWSLLFASIVLGFVATVAALNSTLYSASGFTRAYLEALSRHDLDEALRTDGVTPASDASYELLEPDALAELTGIRLLSDTEGPADAPAAPDLDPAPETAADRPHHLVFEILLDGERVTSEFDVERTGSRFLVFDEWSFSTSPTATLDVTPIGVTDFEANDLAVDVAAGPNEPERYAVLVPGAFTLEHTSELLQADPATTVVVTPAEAAATTIVPKATDRFVDLVQSQLDDVLDSCAEQSVLQPTGCPFGRTVRNRIEGVPEWTVARYPEVAIQPGSTPGTWEVPPAEGAAHLVVRVRSLFDGTVSTIDEDVPFTVGYVISFGDDGGVSVTAQ